MTSGTSPLVARALAAGDHAGVIAAVAPSASTLDAEQRFALGYAQQMIGALDDAVSSYATVVTDRPDHASAWLNLANLYRDTGELDRALRLYERALELRPGHPSTRFNRGECRFALDDWPGGWEDFEARLELAQVMPTDLTFTQGGERVPMSELRWRGGPVRSLLVIAEQGLGDTMQGARWLRPLAEAGVQLAVMEHSALIPLLRWTGVPFTAVPRGRPVTLNDVERWTPLGSVPGALGVDATTAEPQSPYLFPKPARIAHFAALAGGPGLKIGICWRGQSGPNVDQSRFPPIEAVSTILDAPGCTFYALQPLKDSDAVLRDPLANADWVMDADGAFLDTAALIGSLDLVITVDTAIAHLAGALAAPTWLLLKHRGADARWLQGREDTPWYRSMRLRRQPSPGDWSGLAQQVQADLLQLASRETRRP